MKLNAVNNSQSFGMAWHKESKQLLSQSVAALSKRQQPEAIRIINNLEKTSPNHTLKYADGVFLALNKDVSGNGLYEYGFNSFLKGLKKLDTFISRENKIIPIIKETADKLVTPLNFMTKKGIFERGLRINKVDLPYLTTELIKSFAKKGKKPDMEKILKKLTSINEKAEKNNIEISLGFLNRGYRIYKKGTHITGNKNNINTFDTFTEIDKTIEKIIKKTKQEEIKETQKYKYEVDKITQMAKRKEFIKKIKSSKIIQTINKIKDTIFSPLKKLKDDKLKKLRIDADKISQQIEF